MKNAVGSTNNLTGSGSNYTYRNMNHDTPRIQPQRRQIQVQKENESDVGKPQEGQKKTRIKKEIKTGMQFERLTALKEVENGYWLFSCKCGSKKTIRASHVKSGDIRSCGCLFKKAKKHGRCYEPEYGNWSHMKTRCLNPNYESYSHYGGRGIKICREWSESFQKFYDDMGPRPSPKHSLDRIDPNGDYCPENCRWATQAEQCNNNRKNVIIFHNGQSKTLSMWSIEVGVPYHTLKRRIRQLGWDTEKALTTPVAPHKQRKKQ